MNIRQKGFGAEREIATLLNGLVARAMRELGFPPEAIAAAAKTVQRNQNQSAVGGNDLTNTFGLGIEVKRQEQLSINTWWKQCCEGAQRNGELPVLLFRQNKQKWRCITLLELDCPLGEGRTVRAEIDLPTFEQWFVDWVKAKLKQGEQVRT